jgi:hypothetical protein
MGEGKIDVMRDQTAPGFGNGNRVQRWLRATYARSSGRYREEPVMKWPWQVAPGELDAFGAPDVRFGGFGPWFGLAFVIAAVAACAALLAGGKHSALWLLAIVAILVSALVNPELWWARFVPQLWLVPVVVGVWAIAAPSWVRALGWTLIAVLVVDLAMVACPYVSSQRAASRDIRGRLAQIAARAAGEEVTVALWPPARVSSQVRLAEASIRFDEGAAEPGRECIPAPVFGESRLCFGAAKAR